MTITAKTTDVSRAMHVLEGILKGISSDKVINEAEIDELKKWLDNHKTFSYIYPFCEAYEFIERIYEDNKISNSEKEEMLDFCNSFQALNGPIDKLTMEMRNLHGFVHGIIADKVISRVELKALEKWMVYHESNKDKWPYKEIYDMVEKILSDGIITVNEQSEFIQFAESFIEKDAIPTIKDPTLFVGNWMKSESPTFKTIDQIVDRNCAIEIKGKYFCFTGQMKNGKRAQIQENLVKMGGIPVDDVSKKTNYLVIGALSNPCWAYSTYGRKIEKVMNKFKDTKIIHEDDYVKTINKL